MPFTQQEVCLALEHGEFVPYFQPLVDLRSGEVQGFEILARWQHPARGLISPGVFVPLLERYRLMNTLSAALLIPAFDIARTLPGGFGLSVNLSPTQLHDLSLPGLIQNMAEEAEFDLHRLTVELTETALVDDLNLASKVAHEFKERGIHLSLDDFGTGYSSLLHLQSLPFDELKVDASFVRSMTDTRQSRKITSAVINLGLSLGLKTVAEGIENQSQANLLAWQGCNLGQGYLFGQAVPADELGGRLGRIETFLGVTSDVPACFNNCALSLDARPMERFSQLRAVYDSAPVGLGFVDTQLRYVNLNERLAQANGRAVQAHLGLKISEVLPPSVYAQVEPYIVRALQGESVTNFELSRSSAIPGESPGTLMLSYEPVRDEAGEILGVSLAVADITALKQKDEALRESEEHYRHTVELTPQIPWVVDPTGQLISLSSRWRELTGTSTEEAMKFGWLSFVHPDDRDGATASIQRSMKTGEPLDFEHRIQSEGRWKWMRIRGYPRRDADGRIVRWYGSAESIDEHKRAIDELRSSEARLRAVFDAAPVGVILIESESGRFLNANPRAEKLVGYRLKPSMTWSQKGWQLFGTDGNAVSKDKMPATQAIRTGKTTNAEDFLVIRPDGTSLWMNITAAPVRLDNGMQWGVVLILQGIDKARRHHQKLLNSLAFSSRLAAPSLPHSLSSEL